MFRLHLLLCLVGFTIHVLARILVVFFSLTWHGERMFLHLCFPGGSPYIMEGLLLHFRTVALCDAGKKLL